MNKPSFPYFVMNRLGFGGTPADFAAFQALGATRADRLAAYIDQQLDYKSIDDSALEARLSTNNFKTLHLSLTEQYTIYSDGTGGNDAQFPAREVQSATITRALYSKRQLFERIVGFWHNHFSCGIDLGTGPVYVDYDNKIRTHALGNFRTLLEAVGSSTAMLRFLDNASNGITKYVGPGLPRVNMINENYARELMELHTIGVENYYGTKLQSQIPRLPNGIAAGYCESDVVAVAQAFSGWGIHGGRFGDKKNDGTFFYRKGGLDDNKNSWHVPGPKLAFGNTYESDVDLEEGRKIYDWLAYHPLTAKRICEKLCRRFVSDTPPASLVKRAAKVFLQEKTNPLQLQFVMLEILTSGEFLHSRGEKLKRPFNWAISAARATGFHMTVKELETVDGDIEDPEGKLFRSRLGDTGDLPHTWKTPEGPPDIAAPWLGTSSMTYSMRFNAWMVDDLDRQGQRFAPVFNITTDTIENGGLGSPLLTAKAVIDFWWTRLVGNVPVAKEHGCYDEILAFLAQNQDPNTYVFNWADDQKHSNWREPDKSEDWNQTRLRSAVGMMLNSRVFLQQG